MKKYFVSYLGQRFFSRCIAMCIVETNQSMECMHGFLEVMEHIKEDQQLRKCVILNFKELGEDDEPEEQNSESV